MPKKVEVVAAKKEKEKEEAKDELKTADAISAEVKAVVDEETLADLFGKDDEGVCSPRSFRIVS